jgi:HK97 family phage major capsid protein
MSHKQKLRAQLAQIKSDADSILKSAEANSNGLMSEEQKKSFDAKMQEFESIKAHVKALEQMEGVDEATEWFGKSKGRQTEAADLSASGGEPTILKDPKHGFQNIHEFGIHVRQAQTGGRQIDPRIQAINQIYAAPSNPHRETGSDEGVMVPPAFREQIWEAVDKAPGLYNLVDDEPTSSNAVTLTSDESTPWGASGVKAYWAAEAAQMQESKLVTSPRLVVLHKVYAFTTASDEILEDAPRLADRMTRKAGLAIAHTISKSYYRGDGVGKPLGIIPSGAAAVVAGESGQTPGTIVAANIAKMEARMLPDSLANAVWLINQDAKPFLLTMTIGNNAVYMPPTVGFTNAPGGYLLGRPIIPLSHCSTAGTVGDIMLADLKGYYSPRKTSTKFDRSIHLYFDYGVEAFRWTFRVGGQPYLSAPITPENGTATQSHFVTLATRS